MKGKKRIALLTVFIIIMNLFAPYSVLFNSTVQAATGTLEDKPILLSNMGITTKGSNKILCVQLGLATEELIQAADIMIKIDKTKITPCNKKTGVASTSFNLITDKSDYYDCNWQINEYDADNGIYTFTVTSTDGHARI